MLNSLGIVVLKVFILEGMSLDACSENPFLADPLVDPLGMIFGWISHDIPPQLKKNEYVNPHSNAYIFFLQIHSEKVLYTALTTGSCQLHL